MGENLKGQGSEASRKGALLGDNKRMCLKTQEVSFE